MLKGWSLRISAVEEMEKLNVGILIGIGLNIPISLNSNIDLGIKDSYGMLNIRKPDQYPNESTKSNSIGLHIGFKYKL